jgi:S-DNA-T family DNA segregation ATPase FtsK/SpoIIIE
MNKLMVGGLGAGAGLLILNFIFPSSALLCGSIMSAGASLVGIAFNKDKVTIEPETELDTLTRRLIDIMHLRGFVMCKFKITNKVDTEEGYTLHIPIIEGLSTQVIEKCKTEIEEYFNATIKVSYDNGVILLDIFTKQLEKFYPFKLIKTASPTQIPIGYTVKGMKMIDLVKDHNVLISGTAGYGKSSLERAMLTHLICNNSVDDLYINLVDLKRVELGIFKQSSMVNTFCNDIPKLARLLERLKTESLKRYEMFEKENILDISRWNKKHPKEKLRYIITFVDEFSQLGGKRNTAIMDMFQKRLALDRAAGLFYCVCTQRPSAEIITGDIKANIDTRISFKVIDSTNAWIVMDQYNTAELLTIPGRGLIKTGGEIEEFHGMFLDEDTAIKLVKHTFNKGGLKDATA